MLPAFVWSEEFQTQQFSKHFEAFDSLRNAGFFIGEFVWNFADFKTAQSKSHLSITFQLLLTYQIYKLTRGLEATRKEFSREIANRKQRLIY